MYNATYDRDKCIQYGTDGTLLPQSEVCVAGVFSGCLSLCVSRFESNEPSLACIL